MSGIFRDGLVLLLALSGLNIIRLVDGVVRFLVVSWNVPHIVNGFVSLLVLKRFIFGHVDGLAAGESDPPVGSGRVVLNAGANLTIVDVIFAVLHWPRHFIVWDVVLFFNINKIRF